MIPLILLGCGTPSTDPIVPVDGELPVDPAGEIAAAARADLKLKRWRQLQLDLEGALLLPPDQVCNETGLYACTDLHVVPMGGVSVTNGLYRSVDTLSATTGLSIERLVLQACFNRLTLDMDGKDEPAVFTWIDLTQSTAEAGAMSDQVVELYRRLLSRDPTEEERDALLGLHATLTDEGGTNAEWALMTCFAIGTTTEALTY